MSEAAAESSAAAVSRGLHAMFCKLNPRALARWQDEELPLPAHFENVPLLYAVTGDGCGEVTVGIVAERMCLDPSRASRMVTAAIEAGYVTRLASPSDGRRTVLELTESGRKVLTDAEDFHRARYARVMADWPAKEQAEFARLLVRFGTAL